MWDLPQEVDQSDEQVKMFWDVIPGVEFKDTVINVVNDVPAVAF